MEVHGTVHGTSTVHVPSYVKNHGILSGRDLQFLLRETKVSPLQMFHRYDMHICSSVEAAFFAEDQSLMLNVYVEQQQMQLIHPVLSVKTLLNRAEFLCIFESKRKCFKSVECFLKVRSIISFGTEGWSSFDSGYVGLLRRKRGERFDFSDL